MKLCRSRLETCWPSDQPQISCRDDLYIFLSSLLQFFFDCLLLLSMIPVAERAKIGKFLWCKFYSRVQCERLINREKRQLFSLAFFCFVCFRFLLFWFSFLDEGDWSRKKSTNYSMDRLFTLNDTKIVMCRDCKNWCEKCAPFCNVSHSSRFSLTLSSQRPYFLRA